MFDRYIFLLRKQLKREPVEKFYGCLRELFSNCDLGNHEGSIIPDVFVDNMQDGEIQSELMRKKTRTVWKALELAMNIEMGIQNQLKISRTAAYTVSNQITNTSINSIQNSWNRPKSSTTNFTKPTICLDCGYAWSASHRQNFPLPEKNCENCIITNHFAKLCRKLKIQMKPKSSVNNVDDTSSEAANTGTSATVGDKVNQIDNMIQKHSIYDASIDSDHDAFDDNCVAVIYDSHNIREVEPVNMHIQLGIIETKALVDWGDRLHYKK